jgi:Mannosyl-glycoprotein endo-beta-N-acetylglucosaminidase
VDRASFYATYGPYAQKYAAQTGIPASVFLAIIASESNWGAAGSLFGIKGASPSGQSANYASHEVYGGQNVNINDQFATYSSPDEAFNHFIGLISSGRYANAWQQFQQTGDWRGLLQGINAAGYATNPTWYSLITDLAGTVESEMPSGGLGAPESISSALAQSGFYDAASVGGGGTAYSSSAAPLPDPMGPNGRTFNEIRGTDYLSEAERLFYLQTQKDRGNQLGPEAEAFLRSAPMTMQQYDEYGFPISGGGGGAANIGGGLAGAITGLAQTAAQLAGGIGVGGTGAPQPGQRIELGNGAFMEYVPAVDAWAIKEPRVDAFGDVIPGQFEITGWRSATEMAGAGGAVTREQLASAGADFSTPGLGILPNGAIYKQNVDGSFTISQAPSSAATAGGAVNRDQLVSAGADFSSPGLAILPNGAIYKENVDGSFSVSSTPNPEEDAQIISGAGLARLYGDRASGNYSQSLRDTQGTGVATGAAPQAAATARVPGTMSTNPLNNLLSYHQVAQAASTPETTEVGESLGAAEPLFTRRAAPIPINFGGVYEGGGLTQVPGTAGAGIPSFTGYMPGTDVEPWRTSVGFGFNRSSSQFDPNRAALEGLQGAELFDAMLNLQTLRQKAADTGLIMPNLRQLQVQEAQGRAAPGTYKAAVARLAEAIGRPMSALDLLAIPAPSPLTQQSVNPTTGARTSTTYTPERYEELFGRQPGAPVSFASGGVMELMRPATIYDDMTGQPIATAAETGPEMLNFAGVGEGGGGWLQDFAPQWGSRSWAQQAGLDPNSPANDWLFRSDVGVNMPVMGREFVRPNPMAPMLENMAARRREARNLDLQRQTYQRGEAAREADSPFTNPRQGGRVQTKPRDFLAEQQKASATRRRAYSPDRILSRMGA